MNCFNIINAKAVYSEGGSVTNFLREKIGIPNSDSGYSEDNTSEIIEIAYDLQAGSYIEFVNSHLEFATEYANELASLIAPFLSSDKSLLDVGTGELTTLSLLLSNKEINPVAVYAFDISWSRLYLGLSFWKETVTNKDTALFPFSADMKEIPMASKSIDIVTSSHALEPNGGNLTELLRELFRICRDRLVLFEPSYETNSDEGKARMDSLGYIKDIGGVVEYLGGVLHDVVPINNVINPLNPTACYIIEPSAERFVDTTNLEDGGLFSVPGTDFGLVEREGFLVSVDTGLAFPILKDIPILKANAGILATRLV